MACHVTSDLVTNSSTYRLASGSNRIHSTQSTRLRIDDEFMKRSFTRSTVSVLTPASTAAAWTLFKNGVTVSEGLRIEMTPENRTVVSAARISTPSRIRGVTAGSLALTLPPAR